jgi:hypothetical protein
MYDTISPTDYIIVDVLDKEVDRDGLYLIVEQSMLEIRRIRILKDVDGIATSVDNKRHIGYTSSTYLRGDIKNVVCGKILKIVKNDI